MATSLIVMLVGFAGMASCSQSQATSKMAFAGLHTLPLRSTARINKCAVTMQWTPEEKEARATKQRERNERLIRERDERQRKLQNRDQEILEQRNTSPINMDSESKDFVMEDGNWGDKATGLFGWANNNPSSKNAIYDTEFINSAAGGGNVGEMMIEMRGKGKTAEGREMSIRGLKDRQLKLYYRAVGEQRAGEAPVVCVHGVLDHSWSWREMQQLLAQDGVASYALDMPGCGYSSWPQPGFDFDWSEEGVKDVLSQFYANLGLECPVTLMVQGFVFSQYALVWGLENPDKVSKIIALNTPLKPATPLPFPLQQYKLPIVSSFVAQDAMRAERFLEGGCAYAMSVEDADRYREPFLESMMPGLGVVDLMKRYDHEKVLDKVYRMAASSQTPFLVAWGMNDKYLTPEDAQEFCTGTGAEFKAVPGVAGFLVQSDYAESTLTTIKSYLR